MTGQQAELKPTEICSFVLHKQGSPPWERQASSSSSAGAGGAGKGRAGAPGSPGSRCPAAAATPRPQSPQRPTMGAGAPDRAAPPRAQPPSRRALPLAAARSRLTHSNRARSPLLRARRRLAPHEATPLSPSQPMTSSNTQHSHTRHRLAGAAACTAGGPASRVRRKTPEGRGQAQDGGAGGQPSPRRGCCRRHWAPFPSPPVYAYVGSSTEARAWQ